MSFWRELQRRNVYRTAVLYIGGAWVAIEATDLLIPIFDGPQWIIRAVVVAAIIGFPVALLLGWFYELTEKGLAREGDDLGVQSNRPLLENRIVDFIVIAILAFALILTLVSRIYEPEDESEAHEPLSILVSNFQFVPSDDRFAGVLEEALRIELELVPHVDSFPRSVAKNVANSVAGDTELDPEVSTLVALREGIDFVVDGLVERRGETTVVKLEVRRPLTDESIYKSTQVGNKDASLLALLAEGASDLRRKVFADSTESSSEFSESFTTTDLRAAAHYMKGQELATDRRLTDAVAEYNAALEIDPNFVRAYCGLAMAAVYLGNTEEADRAWKQVLARLDSLTDRERLRTLGNYHGLATQEYGKALETYERLIEKYPADAAAHNNLAVVAFHMLDFERALDAGEVLVERFPNRPLYRSNQALYSLYATHFDEARKLADGVVELDPSYPYAWVTLALTALVEGDRSAAEAAYKTLQGNDELSRALGYHGLADLLIYYGDYTEAVEVLEKGMEFDLQRSAHSEAATKSLMLAEVLLQIGDAVDSAAAIERGLHLAGDNSQLVMTAMVYLEMGELDDAAAMADKLDDSLSDGWKAYAEAIRAEVALRGGSFDTAIAHVRSAIGRSDIWYARLVSAHTYRVAGYPVEAYSELKLCEERLGEVLAMFLDDRPTARYIRKLRSEMSKVRSDLNIGRESS